MIHTDRPAKDAVITLLQTTGPCGFDDLVTRLAHYDWNDLFIAVDLMSRDGRLVLHRLPGSDCLLSLPQRQATNREVCA